MLKKSCLFTGMLLAFLIAQATPAKSTLSPGTECDSSKTSRDYQPKEKKSSVKTQCSYPKANGNSCDRCEYGSKKTDIVGYCLQPSGKSYEDVVPVRYSICRSADEAKKAN